MIQELSTQRCYLLGKSSYFCFDLLSLFHLCLLFVLGYTYRWGRCGIEVEDATTQFELSTRPFDPTIHGEYFVGSRKSKCCADVYNDRVRSTLWEKLEEITDLRL